MTTSIMLVTYNRLNLTQRMLDNLFKNTNSPYRLIIVDNGSTDGTVEWLKTMPQERPYCVGYDFHFNENNMGIAIGRNQGLIISNRYNDKWLSTVDNDVEFSLGWLKECIEVIEANQNFAIGINMEGVSYPIITQNKKTFQYKPAGNLGTACTVFDRKLHQLIGFFTTEFGLYGEEDADFFFRARMVGYQMGYIKEMGIHFGEGELDQGEYRDFKTQSHANNLAQFRKNCALYHSGAKSCYIPYP